MIKNVLTSCFMLLCLTAFSQNSEYDIRLLAKFSKKEIKAMSSSDIEYWTFFLDHSYQIQSIPGGKEDGLHHSVSITPSEMSNINILKLDLTPHKVARLYYGIEGTDKMIVLYGQSEIDDKYAKRGK